MKSLLRAIFARLRAPARTESKTLAPPTRTPAEQTFVYVNQDGTVRELSIDEREYLSTEFSGGDGGRPYTKSNYKDRDGWGSMSGFFWRRKLPPNIVVEPVNPDYAEPTQSTAEWIAEYKDLTFEQQRAKKLAQQAEKERLARHPD